jgi:Tol biopolymer transport system component
MVPGTQKYAFDRYRNTPFCADTRLIHHLHLRRSLWMVTTALLLNLIFAGCARSLPAQPTLSDSASATPDGSYQESSSTETIQAIIAATMQQEHTLATETAAVVQQATESAIAATATWSAAITATPTPTPEPTPIGSGTGLISFISDRNGNPDIFSISTEGQNLNVLLHSDAAESQPAWSADGSQLAYSLDNELWLLKQDGSPTVNLTNSPDKQESDPQWGNTGDSLVYISRQEKNILITENRYTRCKKVELIQIVWDCDDLVTGELVRVSTERKNNTKRERNALTYLHQIEIFDMNTNTSQTVYSETSTYNPHLQSPVFSADQSQILFEKMGLLYLLNLADPIPQEFAARPDSRDPAWSPDGSTIAFASLEGGQYELFIMNPDGSDVIRLTDSPGDDIQPAWSVDGLWIAFTSSRDGNQEIYLMRRDGSELHKLSSDPAGDFEPAWMP